MMRIAGDLIPSISGTSHLGIDGGVSAGAFDISTLTPFGHIIQLSGVFADPLLGQSGVIRFNQATPCMEVSVDGGISFACIATTANVVTSVGVIGDADLTGDVDFASPSSGFIVIEDSSDASPLLWSVNTLGLSGLWSFPTNGFPSAMARCYAETFGASTSWVVSHNIGTEDVEVKVYDGSSPRREIIPDNIELTDSNTVTISFNRSTAGRVVVIGCV